MLFTDVLVATDMNYNYFQFIPPFIAAWKKLFPDINIHIVVIAYTLIDELLPYKEYIHLFPPIENVSTAFISQNIRLFYPALLTETKGGILITDMDIIPMSKAYYTDPIKNIDDNKFFCYRPLSCVGPKEMVICYNIAHQKVWKEIFNINSETDIATRINSIYQLPKYIGENAGKHYNPFWITDQLYLYEITQEWHKTSGNLIISNNDKISRSTRLDRNDYPRYNIEFIKNGTYIDFHMPRHYNKYKEFIDNIINLL
jgi:hypothetical protein